MSVKHKSGQSHRFGDSTIHRTPPKLIPDLRQAFQHLQHIASIMQDMKDLDFNEGEGVIHGQFIAKYGDIVRHYPFIVWAFHDGISVKFGSFIDEHVTTWDTPMKVHDSFCRILGQPTYYEVLPIGSTSPKKLGELNELNAYLKPLRFYVDSRVTDMNVLFVALEHEGRRLVCECVVKDDEPGGDDPKYLIALSAADLRRERFTARTPEEVLRLILRALGSPSEDLDYTHEHGYGL